MKYQRFTSLTLGLSFIMMLSSGVLYFIPDRGVTDWSAWLFLGLDKQQWDNLHINFGLLFLGFLVWHIYYNWKPIKNYLKEKKKWVIFTKEFNASLLLSMLFLVGTLWMAFPFSFLVNIGNGIKAKNINHKTPPYAYAERATLRDFCLIMGIDKKEAIATLKKHTIMIDSADKTLKEIANTNGTSAQKLFIMIKELGDKPALPTDIPVGIAHKTLNQLSKEYEIEVQKALKHLVSYGIKVDKNTAFKKIAKTYQLHPAKLYSMLLASQV